MERLIFHLRDIQDFSVEETAEIAGISAGSVKTNLCYARKRLRVAVAAMQKEDRR
jgi:DNA-directed RNA polymerase specialized sigma24 family protein